MVELTDHDWERITAAMILCGCKDCRRLLPILGEYGTDAARGTVPAKVEVPISSEYVD